jgi:hypothetical protein
MAEVAEAAGGVDQQELIKNLTLWVAVVEVQATRIHQKLLTQV